MRCHEKITITRAGCKSRARGGHLLGKTMKRGCAVATIDIFRNEPKLINLSAGEVIFREGEVGSEMFAIVEGAVEIRKQDKRVATLGPSEIFGEMALIDHKPRCASAVALSDAKLAVIGEPRFSLLVPETPYFTVQMLREVTDRLRHALES
ncbi:MAG: cyclic nucleotide-binding domain-containing protein [Panacagrimonas sp.]